MAYGVACAHTSFVAVSEKKVPGQKPERVEIPVNLPAGWVYEKVFGTGAFRGITVGLVSLGSRGLGRTMAAGPVDMLCEELSIGEISAVPESEPADLLKGSVVSKSGGFAPDAAYIADRMIAILIAANKGRNDEAARAFGELRESLRVKVAKRMNETIRAKAYYFALRLARYGYKLERNVTKHLSLKPKPKSIEALAWYYLALREEGRTTPTISAISVLYDGAEYIEWKLGRGARPDDAIWREVP